MSRSKWKGPFINEQLLQQSLKKPVVMDNRTPSIKTMSRSSIIIKKFIGFTILIYNGKSFLKTKITDKQIGHKLGEFAFTRTHSMPKKKKAKKKVAFRKKTT
jgi:small subunit ribosomal protein S19